jgi:hypothetical protein
VIARTQRLIEERGVDAVTKELDLCDLFCVSAGRRFKGHRLSLDSADDDTRRAIAAAVREAQGYFVEDAILDAEADWMYLRGVAASPPEVEEAEPEVAATPARAVRGVG